MYPRTAQGSWLDALTDEDVAFLKRFVQTSRSLKDLVAAYEVSYPTIRIRLDRLVEKIRLLDQMKTTSAFDRPGEWPRWGTGNHSIRQVRC